MMHEKKNEKKLLMLRRKIKEKGNYDFINVTLSQTTAPA
jgi:hypothetical protein